MKLIFTAPYLAPCDWVRVILGRQGIPATLKNEHGHIAAMAVVGGAATFCWPEVWVEDEDFVRASELVAKVRADASDPAEPWQCPHCGESVDGELAECWNCGRVADARGETDGSEG
jgi:hypothetical protein